MEATIPHGRPQGALVALCGAKTRSGGLCQKPPAKGRDRCVMHGGKSLSGIASPRFQHGRRSSNIPARLSSRYQESLADTDLIALRDEVSLTDARLSDLLDRVDTGEAGETWRSLRATYTAAEKAREKWDRLRGTVPGEEAKETFFEAWESIGLLISEGAQDYQAWDEVHRMIEQRRKLAETEAKRLKDMGQMVTAEKAMTLAAALIGVVRTHVTDRDVLAAISGDLSRLLPAGVGEGA